MRGSSMFRHLENIHKTVEAHKAKVAKRKRAKGRSGEETEQSRASTPANLQTTEQSEHATSFHKSIFSNNKRVENLESYVANKQSQFKEKRRRTV